MDIESHYRIQTSLDELVAENIKKNVFSACSVAYFEESNSSFIHKIYNYGEAGGRTGAVPVDNGTVFDLASLTKPLVTALSILSLVEQGKLHLSDPISTYFDFQSDVYKRIQIIHLLEHTAGFPAHREYFKICGMLPDKERETAIFNHIIKEELVAEPGRRELYSDLGYIVLGKLVEKISGEKLDQYWGRTILSPIGLEKGLFFNRNQNVKDRLYSVTGVCQWSNKELSGLVNDDNCRSMGGVAGHAGLFGTAAALVTLTTTLLKMYKGSYIHPALSFEGLRKVLPTKSGRWVLGFDTPSHPVSSSGKYFSTKTIGHLGFTGTSFWLDCEKMKGVVLLTNRVLCGEDLKGIRKFRPQVHDTIMAELTDRKS